jgi:glycosyltransferase involved in cell wall biosynthesis
MVNPGPDDVVDALAGDPIIGAARRGTRPPGVLQVLPALVTGGVERGTIDVALALAAAGWRAVVASSGGPLVRELERAGVAHLILPVDSKNPLVMRANIARLAEAARAHDIDIIHARSRAPAWSARFAARRAGCGFVTTFHGTYNTTNPAKHLYNAVMAKGERVIAISDFIGRHVVARYGAHPERVRVIVRGIDLATFDPGAVSPERMIQLARAWRLEDGVPVILLPGRLTDWKGQSVLIEAIARLKRQDLRCLLVGDDQGRAAYRQRLEDEIERLRLRPVVHIIGPCNDMPAAYMLADAVVSASTDPEAFGRVAVEAQAMGRPVIASDHGAARETVIDRATGWLVPPADAQALAEALRTALALDSPAREAMARRAMAHVRSRFGKDRMCDATLEVYAELLAERARA